MAKDTAYMISFTPPWDPSMANEGYSKSNPIKAKQLVFADSKEEAIAEFQKLDKHFSDGVITDINIIT